MNVPTFQSAASSRFSSLAAACSVKRFARSPEARAAKRLCDKEGPQGASGGWELEIGRHMGEFRFLKAFADYQSRRDRELGRQKRAWQLRYLHALQSLPTAELTPLLQSLPPQDTVYPICHHVVVSRARRGDDEALAVLTAA